MELFKHFTDASQGVRRLGAAAVDICHVALGEIPHVKRQAVINKAALLMAWL